MRTWLPLVALCGAAYLLGFTVKVAWGGLFFLSYAAISLGLWCFSLALAYTAKDRLTGLLCIGVAIIESGATMVMVSAWMDYHSWGWGLMSWYYSNWAWALDWLTVVEAALLLIFPPIWVCRGHIASIYRSIRASIALWLMAGYGDSIVISRGIWAEVPDMRGAEV